MPHLGVRHRYKGHRAGRRLQRACRRERRIAGHGGRSQTHCLHPRTSAAGPRGFQWHPTVAELSPRTRRRTRRQQRQESGHALGMELKNKRWKTGGGRQRYQLRID
ncbi:hypothetical protein NDU88_001869 [Pleurodeles waltl]|uniref:Uncharacterized protein n=1 Tax=Pleurodeles waltl TaxID=8319 RepID=A0AAV7T1R2_PLEWA|nr:hypothetical protein NDU88_001869 [Pleurodeles waltl]